MTYEDAKAYMEEVSRTGSILGLTNIINLMKELGMCRKNCTSFILQEQTEKVP